MYINSNQVVTFTYDDDDVDDDAMDYSSTDDRTHTIATASEEKLK